MHVNADALDILTNILDRAAATAGPFWEPESQERDRTSDLLGSVEIAGDIADDGTVRVPGSVLLAPAILLEVALDHIQGASGCSREEAIFGIREDVTRLLGPDA